MVVIYHFLKLQKLFEINQVLKQIIQRQKKQQKEQLVLQKTNKILIIHLIIFLHHQFVNNQLNHT